MPRRVWEAWTTGAVSVEVYTLVTHLGASYQTGSVHALSLKYGTSGKTPREDFTQVSKQIFAKDVHYTHYICRVKPENNLTSINLG